MQSATRYLRNLAFSTLTILGLVALFNLLVDPYGIFQVISLDGFNRIKSQASQQAELFKRTAAERMRPKALILGNSRAEIGFDPKSPAWPASIQPVFNLALAGGGINSALDELTQVLTYATPKLIVVGLDFLDFRISSVMSPDSPTALADRFRWWRERFAALLTMNALVDSLATLRAQHDLYPTSLREDGFNPMRDYIGVARREGYYSMFRQRNQENAKSYGRGSKTIYTADGRPAPEFRTVERILDIAGGAGIQVRFVLYPVHAHTLVLFHKAGIWPAFEAWKRELVKIVDSAPPGIDVELWDFSGFSTFAVEDVPPPGDTNREMRWYWEAGHFKSSLGNSLLAHVFGTPADAPQWGRQLTGANLEKHLQAQRVDRDHYESTHSKVVAELAAVEEAANPRAQRSASKADGPSP